MGFDSHAHLDLAAAGNSLQWKALLDRAHSAGIRCILIPAVHPDRWNNLLERVCAAYQRGTAVRLFVSLGIHPWALKSLTDAETDAALDRLKSALHPEKRPSELRAIGETGLDYRAQTSPEDKARQRRVFRKHLELARLYHLPLTIHCVSAYGDLLEELRACPPPPSMIHGYSGKAELAKALCRMGHAIGVGGMITHPHAKHIKRAILSIPPDKLLLETDAPDQTPWTLRPSPNEPSFLPEIAKVAAALLEQDPVKLLESTGQNAARYLNVPWPAL